MGLDLCVKQANEARQRKAMTFEQHAVLQKKLAEDARRKQEEKEKKDGT